VAPLVYFIQAGKDGPIKIGVADDPEQRRNDMQTGNHAELTLLAIAPGGVAYERELHSLFADWRIRGEWFDSAAPGLTDLISRALHNETLLAIHDAGVCLFCERNPIVPPRMRFCSEECASGFARFRSKHWKREAKRRAK
jgi:hypothetical protein